MSIIENSQDLFYVVLSFCALSLTVFLCWLIYYMVMILKQGYAGIREMREMALRLETAVKSIKEKFEQSTTYLVLLGEGLKKLLEIFRSQSGTKEPASKEKKVKKNKK